MKLITKEAFHKRFLKWSRFMEKDFLKILSFYGLINMIMVLGFVWLETLFQAKLDLDPAKIPRGDNSMLPLAVILLPFTLLLEDLGIRLMPWIFIHDIFRLHTIEVEPVDGTTPSQREYQISDKRKWRVWLYHNTFTFYIVVSALWHSLLHQSNVVTANPLGRLVYLGIQIASGMMLAWIFIRKGFWESYTLHVAWDFLLIALILLSSLIIAA